MKKTIVFVILGGILLFMSCDSKTEAPPPHSEHDGHMHEKTEGKKINAHEHSSHAEKHGEENENEEGDHEHTDTPTLQQLAEKKCEHGILQIDCDGCRSELGVVKIPTDLASRLIKTEKVAKSQASYRLEVGGEVKSNQLKTVAVPPMVSGRVIKANKRLGEEVKAGELLAVLHSQDYGKAKLEYISAYQRYAIAQKNLEWVNTTHENLAKFVANLQESDKNQDLVPARIIGALKMGKEKEKLVEVVSAYRLTRIKYAREKQVISDIRRLLDILKKSQNIKDQEREIRLLQVGDWKTKLLGASSRLSLADKIYQREKSLIQSNASTQKELHEAESTYQSARADYEGVMEEAALWVQQKDQELQSELDSVAGRYQSVLEEIDLDLQIHKMEAEKEQMEAFSQRATAEKQLYLLGLTPADISSTINIEHQENFGTLEIRAPISGTIIDFQVSEGQFVEAQKELYIISDLNTLWIWCDLYEHDLPKLKGVQHNQGRVHITGHILKYNNQEVSGVVDYISDVVDEKTRTVKLRVVISNGERHLKPGMFVKVNLKIPLGEEIISVPEDAVFSDENQTFVFKKWQDNMWVRCDVVTGLRLSDRREIVNGIDDGDIIAVQGGFMLKSEILKSKMGAG